MFIFHTFLGKEVNPWTPKLWMNRMKIMMDKYFVEFLTFLQKKRVTYSSFHKRKPNGRVVYEAIPPSCITRD